MKYHITAEDFRELLKTLTGIHGSQKELAYYLGISASYMNDLVRGRREPGPKVLKAMMLERVVCYRKAKA